MTVYQKPYTDATINILDLHSATAMEAKGINFIVFLMNDSSTMQWDFPTEHERDKELQIFFDLLIATRNL